MADANQILKNVHRHKWKSLQDWVNSLDELADLTDDEISDIIERNDGAGGGTSDFFK